MRPVIWSLEYFTSSVCTAGNIAPSAKPSRKRKIPNCNGVVTHDMAKNNTTAKINVAIKIRSVPIRSPNLPSRGAEISAEMPGTEAISPLRKAILELSGTIDLINSARIGPIEPLHNWITIVVKNRLITSAG